MILLQAMMAFGMLLMGSAAIVAILILVILGVMFSKASRKMKGWLTIILLVIILGIILAVTWLIIQYQTAPSIFR